MDISSSHLAIIKLILQKFLPADAKVWVFGSRTKKTKKKYSDLDLAIDINQQKLPIYLLTQLDESFDESDLPYKVDILDLNDIDDKFRNIIQKNMLSLDWKHF